MIDLIFGAEAKHILCVFVFAKQNKMNLYDPLVKIHLF